MEKISAVCKSNYFYPKQDMHKDRKKMVKRKQESEKKDTLTISDQFETVWIVTTYNKEERIVKTKYFPNEYDRALRYLVMNFEKEKAIGNRLTLHRGTICFNHPSFRG